MWYKIFCFFFSSRRRHTRFDCDWSSDVCSSDLRYDLWKLRAKGLVEKIPHSRRYRLLPHGYQICLVFLKLYEKIYAPLTAGILQPSAADRSEEHTSELQSQSNLVCRLLLEKKKKNTSPLKQI